MPAADEFEALLLGSSRLACFFAGRGSGSGSVVSASSLKACAFIRGVDPVFFRSGFVMGDFPTLALTLVFTALLFLTFLARSLSLGAAAEDDFPSRSMPSGELEAVADAPRSKMAIESDWACSAGEVRGLKYEFGTVNAWSTGNWLSSGVTAGETRGVKDICKERQQYVVRLAPTRAGITDILFFHPLEAFVHLLVLLRGLVGMGVVLMTPGLYLQALRGGRDHATLLLREEGGLLLLYLPVLFLQLLLLQELNLGVECGDGVALVLRGHHGGRYRRVSRRRGHGRHLGVHGGRHEDGAVRPTHGRVERLAMWNLHHGPGILALKVEVEVQPVAEAGHAVHVEELLKVIVAVMHAVVLIVPHGRIHRDRHRGSGCCDGGRQ